jgi:Helix-turn-helix domain
MALQAKGTPQPEIEANAHSLAARWKHESLFDKGFVSTPVRFLELYAHLKPHPLTPGEALFVLELMSFKWTEAAPFPSYKRVAERMNISDKMVRRYAQNLEAKGYLRRHVRRSQTNLFNLSGLFDALADAVARERREADSLVTESGGVIRMTEKNRRQQQ